MHAWSVSFVGFGWKLKLLKELYNHLRIPKKLNGNTPVRTSSDRVLQAATLNRWHDKGLVAACNNSRLPLE